MRSTITDIEGMFSYYILNKTSKPPPPTLPKILFVNPTNFCNAKCTFCAYRKVDDDFKTLGMGEFRKAIDQYWDLGGRKVSLTPTIGEVLLDSLIHEKIAYAKQKGMWLSIVSNGILLNQNENWKKLLDADINELIFSMGDIIPKYEAIVFGINEAISANKMVGLLKMLAEMRLRGRGKIRLAFRSMRTYAQIMDDMESSKFWQYYEQGYFDIEFLTGYDNWGGKIAQQELTGMQKLKRPHQFKKYPCNNLYNLSVLGNGDFRICGCRLKDTLADGLVVGNIGSETIATVLKSEKWKDILTKWEKGEFPEVCKECSFYSPRYGYEREKMKMEIIQ